MGVSVVAASFWRFMAMLARIIGSNPAERACWRRVLKARPTDAAAFASTGFLLAQIGRIDEAISALQQAVSVRSDQSGDWFNLGYLLQQNGRHDEAVTAFRRALQLDDRLDRAYYGQALSLIKAGELEQAVPLLRRTIELQPLSPFGFYQLGHVYHRLNRPESLSEMVQRLAGFEPQVARQLARETGAVQMG